MRFEISSSNPTDIEISQLVGMETYKALYFYYPNLYSYISYDLDYPINNHSMNLVGGIISTSGFDFETSGFSIRNGLESLVKSLDLSLTESKESNQILVEPLIDSSYKIKNFKNTPWENFLWIVITIFLAGFIIIYLYYVNFWGYIFNNIDGIACYDCPSIFQKLF